VCAFLTEAKNLSTVETRTSGLAGATADVKSRIVQFAWWMKKNGYRESTIRVASTRLETLNRKGANLSDPDSVKSVIAEQTWTDSGKLNVSAIYTLFLKMQGLTWEQPIYKATHKIPFIPTEKEIDTLIAGSGKKLATFLQLLKETGARSGELQNVKWTDLDYERRTIRIAPEKNSNPRILKVSSKCIGMVMTLAKKSQKIFGDINPNTLRTGLGHQRKRIAQKLNNPRLNQIHFHTLRHWKATKDPIYVMQYLGHKKMESTLLYIQMEQAIFSEESDEFTVRVAKNPNEVKEFLEVGFEFVCQKDGILFFRKRK
jgi:integrase